MDKILNGNLVILQSLRPEDLIYIQRLYQNDKFMHDFGKMSENEKSMESLLKWYEDCHVDDDIELFSIKDQKTNQIIGYLQLDDALTHDECVWLVIGIGPEIYQNKGYGTDTLSLIINHLFNQRNIQTIRLAVLNHNDRAIRVYQKFGFEIEVNFPIQLLLWKDAFHVLQMKLTKETFLLNDFCRGGLK